MMRFLSVMLVLLPLGLSAKAQTYRGVINGTVADPAGAATPTELRASAREKPSTRNWG